MRLCFGTLATVLNCCRQNTLQQASLIARIVKCIDRHSSYIANEDRFKLENEWEIAGDGPAVSKLLHCTRPFVLESGSIANKPITQNVIQNFEENVAPFIAENKKAAAIIALLHIIRQDNTIDSSNKGIFEEFLRMGKQELLQQSNFVFSDLVGRILVYTVYGNIDNRVGEDCVHLITADYIDKITEPYANEYEWNPSTQTLALPFVEIFLLFDRAIQTHQIDEFLKNIDPTGIMESDWIDRFEDFLSDTEAGIWVPFAPTGLEQPGTTICMVQEFAQTLDDYTNYLGKNMRPIAEEPNLFVPLYREENAKWALAFEKTVGDYHQQLQSIYEKICTHILFAQIPVSD